MEKFTIAIPKAILSFPYLIEKQPIDSVYIKTEDKRRYSANFILSKDNEDHMKVVKEMRDKINKILDIIKLEQNVHILIKDGDKELDRIEDTTKKEKHEYKKNNFIISASNRFQPILTGKNGESFDPVVEENIFYPGCYVHAFIELVPYKFNGSWKGIFNRLQHVQFSKDGDMLGAGRLSGAEIFDKFEDADDDFGTFNKANQEKDLF